MVRTRTMMRRMTDRAEASLRLKSVKAVLSDPDGQRHGGVDGAALGHQIDAVEVVGRPDEAQDQVTASTLPM